MAVMCHSCPQKSGSSISEELGPLLAGGGVEAKSNDSQSQHSEEASSGVANPWTLLQAVRAMRSCSPSRHPNSTSGEPLGQDEDDFRKANRVWGIMKKRPRYQQVRKSRVVADCVEDGGRTESSGFSEGAGAELQSMLSPIVTIHGLRERISNMTPRNQNNRQPPPAPPASPTPQPPNKLEVKGDFCLLTDSPFRILRAHLIIEAMFWKGRASGNEMVYKTRNVGGHVEFNVTMEESLANIFLLVSFSVAASTLRSGVAPLGKIVQAGHYHGIMSAACYILKMPGRILAAASASSPAVAAARDVPIMMARNWRKVFMGLQFPRKLSAEELIKAAESGNIEDFGRLYLADPARLGVRDSRGRAAAHQAAARNKLNILQFIANHGGDLNIRDHVGNTPLHVAVEHEALEVVDYLLQNPAVDTSVLNDKKQAPVHLVTELNKVAVLEVMSRHKERINIQQGGEHGRTALHLAAIYDHEECARILITEFGASPRQPCNNGYYPIHEAAKNASSRTMEVFLQWGESKGCPREEMISFYDSEGNVPLHSAVHGGDIKAVELCLKSGAKISTQQHDLSTPVHLACAQGAIDIVKLMFGMQPVEKVQCLASCDVQKMTPLHCAAMFDHPEIVEYLISEGADINPLDKERRSPLLLAAQRAGWRTVQSLIRLGANIHLKESNSRNVLHLVVMNGGLLEEFADQVIKAQSKTSLLQLLNEKDKTGCSPLHYASREGHIRSLENLIRLGACINLKNNNNESPLHFAARYGRYNTVRQLLDSEKGTFIINESDGEGLTPLHIASQQGHTRVVQLLLNRGALLHRDHNGRNPLHLAAMSGYTQTMELLHSVHSHLLDQVDKDGNTALHLATMDNKPNAIALLLSMDCKLLYNSHDMSAIDYAIYYKFPEAALAMVTHEERAQEVMALRSDKHPCVTLALIASMPKVFEAVQDKCITKANCKKDSKSFYIKYSFSCLQCPALYAQMDQHSGKAVAISKPIPLPALNIKYSFHAYQQSCESVEKQRKLLSDPKWRPPPLAVVNAMVAHGRVELLAHPLSQKYLQMKWNSYGKYFHLANLLFYTIFLVFVTFFAAHLMEIDDEEDRSISVAHTNETLQNKLLLAKTVNMPMMYTSAVVIMTYISLNSLREMLQLYQQRWHYLLDPNNLVSWLLYVTATIMVVPIFLGHLVGIQLSCASITVFLSWFNLLLYLQRFDQVGIYVVMFLEILQTLIKVLIVFSILIIAFGLAFYILLSRGGHLSFKNVPMSLMRTFAMMLGEIDFLGTYVQPYFELSNAKGEGKSLPFPFPAFLILGLFMVLMPILLMNLLIGLAVGDIESVRRNAQLKRLAMQVVLHTELERKLPQFLLEKVDKSELIEFPNDTKGKLGFLDAVLRKWFWNPFSDDGLEMVLDNSEDYVTEELSKQKRRLKEISSALETQHLLLRLIVQKMEIKTEADDVDEGVSPNELRPLLGIANKWTSPRVRKKLRSTLSFTRSQTT